MHLQIRLDEKFGEGCLMRFVSLKEAPFGKAPRMLPGP